MSGSADDVSYEEKQRGDRKVKGVEWDWKEESPILHMEGKALGDGNGKCQRPGQDSPSVLSSVTKAG